MCPGWSLTHGLSSNYTLHYQQLDLDVENGSDASNAVSAFFYSSAIFCFCTLFFSRVFSFYCAFFGIFAYIYTILNLFVTCLVCKFCWLEGVSVLFSKLFLSLDLDWLAKKYSWPIQNKKIVPKLKKYTQLYPILPKRSNKWVA